MPRGAKVARYGPEELPDSLTRPAPAFQLAALPDDALALIFQQLHPTDILRACSTARAWRLDAPRPQLWRAVAMSFSVELPGARRAGGSTRLSANLRRAFFLSYIRVQKAERVETERAVWQIWLKLHRSDCEALVKKAHCQHPLLVEHRISFYADRTLIMLAAWRGRVRVVQFLLEQCSADVNAADGLGFTALMMAAWAGRLPVVRYLLDDAPTRPDLTLTGIPPQSSSCGGRGPFTAEVWARRKGFAAIANLLQAASSESRVSSDASIVAATR
eukprot:COSAG02_NODE_6337_length_3641_cov_1.518351_3_plen_274_part_00